MASYRKMLKEAAQRLYQEDLDQLTPEQVRECEHEVEEIERDVEAEMDA